MKRLILWSVIAVLAACGPAPAPPVPPPKAARELAVAILTGPATWFFKPDGEDAGLDRDLAALFAGDQGLTLRVIAADSPARLLAATVDGEASVAAGGLLRPVPGADAADGLLYTTGYYSVEPMLVYNTAVARPESWRDLVGETVGIVDGTLGEIRTRHPDVLWQPMTTGAADGLLEQVSDGTLLYAVVASNEAAIARNVFLNVEPAFAVGPTQELVWALPATRAALRDAIDAFFERIRRDGTLQRLIDRYFGYSQRVRRTDAAVFQDRIRVVLPAFASFFHQAQQDTGIDWRLLAAIAYRESRWDPAATSTTNVRGMMMLTEDTAKRMAISDRLDARQSILAGARYLAALRRSLPQRIRDPDRTWLALAAFNMGLGHLEDARVLAQRRGLNPDAWSDVKKALPLLLQPDPGSKYGVARGGQAVVFVETVRAYYDVLLRLQEPYYGARLRAAR